MARCLETGFASSGGRCAASHHVAGKRPGQACLVMAHGFGATRHYGLDAYAQRFGRQGWDALVFDHRHFGESEGEPRGLVQVVRQLADWRAAIAHARSLGYGTIVLWGTSFSGGHVLQVAAQEQGIAAVIAQVPHIDGVATARAMPARLLPAIAATIVLDALLRLVGRRYRITTFGKVGRVAAMSTPGAYEAMIGLLPDGSDDEVDWREYFESRNTIPALGLVEAMRYSPGAQAASIPCPVLLQAGEFDRTTPFAAARQAAERIPDCEFRAYAIDHFDGYRGPHFEIMIGDQLDFLQRRVAHQPAITDLRDDRTPAP